jgi:hypothetical protein
MADLILLFPHPYGGMFLGGVNNMHPMQGNARLFPPTNFSAKQKAKIQFSGERKKKKKISAS